MSWLVVEHELPEGRWHGRRDLCFIPDSRSPPRFDAGSCHRLHPPSPSQGRASLRVPTGPKDSFITLASHSDRFPDVQTSLLLLTMVLVAALFLFPCYRLRPRDGLSRAQGRQSVRDTSESAHRHQRMAALLAAILEGVKKRDDMNTDAAPGARAATGAPATAEQYGDLIGNEAEATGHNVFLGPGLDIARVPVFGRLFEALGEDPVLTGRMAAAYIRGVQSHPIVACAKHYNMNTQEQQRMGIDAHVDERTLQEIYTLPFEIVVKEAQLGSAMGAFNKVNGIFACEQPHLLTDILKQQLGFTGWVMSDYGATQSTVEAASAGLDQEMPAATYFGDRLVEATQAGQVSMATLEDKVRRILRTMFALGLFEHPVGIRPFSIQEHGRWARTIASQGIVLLKNREALLPLSSDALTSVAIIGADANANIAGGGSSLVKPTYLVSMLEGIRRRAEAGTQVEYAEGVDPLSAADVLPGHPTVPSSVLTPAGSGSGVRGLHAEYWTNPHFAGEPSLVRTDWQVALNLGFFNYPGFNASLLPQTPLEFNNIMSVRWTGSITAPATGDYTLSLTHLGTARLFLDGQRLIDDPGVTLSTQSASVHLVAGEAHALQIEYASDRPEQGASWIGSDSGSEANGGYGGGGGGGFGGG